MNKKLTLISLICTVFLFCLCLFIVNPAAKADTSAYDKIFVYDQYGGGWEKTSLNYGASGNNNMQNGGCHIFAYAHCIQWLTGNKISYADRSSLINELIRICDIPWGPTDYNSTNPQTLYNRHIINNYGAKQVSIPASASAMDAHFANGGAIIANPGGHYHLAVGSTYADFDNDGSTELYIHIVDSSCQATWWRTNQNLGSTLYTYSSHNAITGYTRFVKSYNANGSVKEYGYVNGTQGSKWGGGEYWVSYSIFKNYRLDKAYLPNAEPKVDLRLLTNISSSENSVLIGTQLDFQILTNFVQEISDYYYDMYVWKSTDTTATWVGVTATKASYSFLEPGDYYIKGRVHNTSIDMYSDAVYIRVIEPYVKLQIANNENDSSYNTEIGKQVNFEFKSNVAQGEFGFYFDMYVWYSTDTTATWVGVAGTKAFYSFMNTGDYYIKGRIHNKDFDIYSEPISVHVIPEIVLHEPDFIIPSSIITIDDSAFEEISATVVYIPNNCRNIGKWCFRNCQSLTQIRIPANCSIGEDAFAGCKNLVIFGTRGSSAEAYANNHSNCVFVPE